MDWIRLHTKIKEWRWWNDASVLSAWIHILLEANTEDRDWKNITVRRGSFVTSLKHLSASCGLSVDQIRLVLKKLQSTQEITVGCTNKYTIINVCKYDDYQLSPAWASQTNPKQIPNKSQTTENSSRACTCDSYNNININNNITTTSIEKDKKKTTTIVVVKEKEKDLPIFPEFEQEPAEVLPAVLTPSIPPPQLYFPNRELELRAVRFWDSICRFHEKYNIAVMAEFYEYWTEPNKSQTKMKFETEKTWDISRRLGRWANGDFVKPKRKTKTDIFRQAIADAIELNKNL